VWAAPFVLLVLDDSRQQQLEYANAAAERLFGRGYLDLFGTEGHELVAQDEAAQVGAAWRGGPGGGAVLRLPGRRGKGGGGRAAARTIFRGGCDWTRWQHLKRRRRSCLGRSPG
jgi:PAS domain-containing protein